MSALSAVLRGRALAESLMVDACTITRRDGTSTTNPTTGAVTPNVTTVYTGKCRVQNRAPRTQDPAAGEAVWVEHLLELQLPMSVTGVRTGDVATITASVLDPDLAGRRLRVSVPVHKSHATARRLPCVEGGPDA